MLSITSAICKPNYRTVRTHDGHYIGTSADTTLSLPTATAGAATTTTTTPTTPTTTIAITHHAYGCYLEALTPPWRHLVILSPCHLPCHLTLPLLVLTSKTIMAASPHYLVTLSSCNLHAAQFTISSETLASNQLIT